MAFSGFCLFLTVPSVVHACWVNFNALISSADFFKTYKRFQKIPFVLNSFVLNQARHFVRPDLSPDY